MRSAIVLHCTCLLLAGLIVACAPAPAPAANDTRIDLSLNLVFNDPQDATSGGSWQLAAKCQGDIDTTAYGIFGLDVLLTGIDSVSAAAPKGTVNASDPAGFSQLNVFDHGNYLEVVLGQIPLLPPLDPGDQQSLLYDVGTLENGSPDAPGYSGPAITLTGTSGIPWATGDVLGDSAWDTAAVMLSGAFPSGAIPNFDFFSDATHDSTGNIFTSVPGSSQGVGTVEFADHLYTFVRDNLIEGVPGDYNGDGTTSAADYTIWRDNLGATGTPGEVPGDGTGDDLLGIPDGDVDEFDFSYWKANFGATGAGAGSGEIALASGAVAGTAVPEPATWTLLAMAAGMLLLRRLRPAPFGRGRW
jgi:hypothetical protein